MNRETRQVGEARAEADRLRHDSAHLWSSRCTESHRSTCQGQVLLERDRYVFVGKRRFGARFLKLRHWTGEPPSRGIMRINFKVDDRTLAAWRDFAIGLALFFVALRVVRSVQGVTPAALMAIQVLLAAVTVFVHVTLYRLGRFTEVTATVSSFGRVGAARLTVVGVAVVVLMFSVWRLAQILGGAIERPLPWGPEILDRSVFPVGNFLAITLYFVVTAPIIEELCFRGWMQRGLGHRFNPAITLVTPALLFAALHAPLYSHPAYLVIPLALGLTLGLVAERSRSLWPPVVLHSLWNFTMLAVAIRYAERPPTWRAPEDALDIVSVLVVIGLSSVVLPLLLPRADHRTDTAGATTVLDTQAAA